MTLTPEQGRKLQRIANRRTLYEAVVTAPDGRKALLAYCSHRSKVGMRDAIHKRGAAIVAFLRAEPTAMFAWQRGATAMTITGGGVIDWSGRTQRDAIMEGELPYVGAAQ